MFWNIVYSVDGMFRRVSKCWRNLHTTLELGLISMTSRHPETGHVDPPQLLHGLATVLLLIGIQVGGFRRDVVPGDTTWTVHVQKLGGLPESYGNRVFLAAVNTKTSWCCQDWPTHIVCAKGLRTHNLSGAARQDWGSSSEPCGCTFLGLTTGVWC